MDRRTQIARLFLDGAIPEPAARWLAQDSRIAPFVTREQARRKFRSLYFTGKFSVHRALSETAKVFRKGRTTLRGWAAEDNWTAGIVADPAEPPVAPSEHDLARPADESPDDRRSRPLHGSRQAHAPSR